MAALIVEVADAIVSELQEIAYGETVTVRRNYGDVNNELHDDDLQSILIEVVPWRIDPDMDTSHYADWTLSYDVFVRRSLTENEEEFTAGIVDRAEIDRLVGIVQDTWEHFWPQGNATHTLTTTSGYEAKYDPGNSKMLYLFHPLHLKKLRQFTGWLRLAYIVSKAQ
jgi:hypothetical protein